MKKVTKIETAQHKKFLAKVAKMETQIGEALDVAEVPVSSPAACALLVTAAHIGHMSGMTLEQMVIWLEQGIEDAQEHISDMEANGIVIVRK